MDAHEQHAEPGYTNLSLRGRKHTGQETAYAGRLIDSRYHILLRHLSNSDPQNRGGTCFPGIVPNRQV